MKARAIIEFYDEDSLSYTHKTDLVELDKLYSVKDLDVYGYEFKGQYAEFKKPIHEISDISEVNK